MGLRNLLDCHAVARGPVSASPSPDYASNDQIWIVKGRAESVAHGIAQLSALVDRTGRRRGHMTGDAARERELLEQLFQAGLILGNVGINLGPGTFEINVSDHSRTAVTGTGNVDDVQIMLFDNAV